MNTVVVPEMFHTRPSRHVLVVMPTYNECSTIARLVVAVGSTTADLLVVDDASPDGTADAAHAAAKSAPERVMLMRRPGKLGLGTAYVDGFAWALEETTYDVVIEMDADFSHDPDMVDALAAAARTHGFAVGSRYVAGGSTPDWPLRRRLLSRFANVYARAILKLRFPTFDVHDATAGFVAWRRDVMEKVLAAHPVSNGYAFQIETKLTAVRAGFTPKELPVVFQDRARGKSKMSLHVIREAVLMPWRLLFRS